MNQPEKVFYKDLSYEITGLLFKTHNELGRYCNEQQYGDKFEKLLQTNSIKYEREKILPISFDGEMAGRNKLDFLIEDKIIIELKAKRLCTREDYYQVQRYLHALNKRLGLLVNFRDKFLKPKRILNSQAPD